MDEATLKLDGNAAAGLLGEVFRFEMTTAALVCRTCGHEEMLGGLAVYQPGTMGTVIRCLSCDSALLRITRHSGHYWLDMPAARHLRIPEDDNNPRQQP